MGNWFKKSTLSAEDRAAVDLYYKNTMALMKLR